MMHVKARVLAQIIWGATGNALVDVEEGQTTRSPRAWAEVAFLTGASTIKYARDCAAEVIGASVAWRLCAAARPTLLAEYAAGDFSLDALVFGRRCFFFRLSEEVLHCCCLILIAVVGRSSLLSLGLSLGRASGGLKIGFFFVAALSGGSARSFVVRFFPRSRLALSSLLLQLQSSRLLLVNSMPLKSHAPATV